MVDSTIVLGRRLILALVPLLALNASAQELMAECGAKETVHRFPNGAEVFRFVKYPSEFEPFCKGLFRGETRVLSSTHIDQIKTFGANTPFFLVRVGPSVQLIHETRNTELVANAAEEAKRARVPKNQESEHLRELIDISPIVSFEANDRFFVTFTWFFPWSDEGTYIKSSKDNHAVTTWLVREDGKSHRIDDYGFSPDEKEARSDMFVNRDLGIFAFRDFGDDMTAITLDDLNLIKEPFVLAKGAADLNGNEIDDEPAYDAQGKVIVDLEKFVSSYAKIISPKNTLVLDAETEKALAENTELLPLRKMMATANTVILGEPGTGKTYLADLYVKGLLAGKFDESNVRDVIYLDSAKLNAGTMYVGTFEARVGALMKLARQRKALVIVDRLSVHAGGGTSSHNANDTISYLRTAMSAGQISVLATDNVSAYQAAFATDQELSSLLRVYRKIEPDFEKTKAILREKAEQAGLTGFSDEVLDQLTTFSNEFNAVDAQPRKSIDFLEYIKGELKFSKKTPSDLTTDDIRKMAQERYQVNPAFADVSKVDDVLKNAREILDTYLVGLEAQKVEALNFVRQLLTGTSDPDKPAIRSITIGPRGTGKTEFAVRFAQAIGVPMRVIEMNGAAGFSEPGVLLGQIAETIKQNPFAVIVLDEIEKAHPTVQAAVLGILNNGYFTINSGKTSTRIDARKASFFMTSNANDKIISEAFLKVSDEVMTKASPEERLNEEFISKQIESELRKALSFETLEASIIKEGVLSGPLLDRASLKSLVFPATKYLFRKIVTMHVDRILKQISKSRRKPVTLVNRDEVIETIVTNRYRPGVSNRSSTEYLDRMLRTLAAESITSAPDATELKITWDVSQIPALSDCNQALRPGLGFHVGQNK